MRTDSSLQWTSKTYIFDRPKDPLPPLIYQCCKDLVASIPWSHVFGSDAIMPSTGVREDATEEDEDWKSWSTDYEPEAGVVKFALRLVGGG